MNKQVFTVRSVSAALKGGRTGTAASLALIQIGFAPQEYSDSTCTSVPREGERFLVQIDGDNSNRFFLNRANRTLKKWDNVVTGIFTRTGGMEEVNGSRVFRGSSDKYEMISVTTDSIPIAGALKDVPVEPPVKAPAVIPQAPILSSPKAPQKPKLGQEEVAEFCRAFLEECKRDPFGHRPYEITKAVLHLANGGYDSVKRISILLNLSTATVSRSLSLRDLPLDWIEKMRKETPPSMKLRAGELFKLSKVSDRAEREKRYSDLLAEKARKSKKAPPKEKAEAAPVADTPEIREYAEKFVEKQASRTTPSRNETQADTIEAILWLARKKLGGQQIVRLLKVSSPTVYTYLPLLHLPEEWLTQLSLDIPKEDRLLPHDAVKLAAIEDVEERKRRYEEILGNQRKKVEVKQPKPASAEPAKRKYTRRAVPAETTPAAQPPAQPLSMAEKVEGFRTWIRQGKEMLSEIKRKGDNKIEPHAQAALLEAILGLIKILEGISKERALQKVDPYPQDVLYFVNRLAPILLHGDTIADELEQMMVS